MLQGGTGLAYPQWAHQSEWHGGVTEREARWGHMSSKAERAPGPGIVLQQLTYAAKARQRLFALAAGVQAELAVAVFDAHVGWTSGRLKRQSQHVERVAAVPYQEGAFQLVPKQQLGLTSRHRPPVPAYRRRQTLMALFSWSPPFPLNCTNQEKPNILNCRNL